MRGMTTARNEALLAEGDAILARSGLPISNTALHPAHRDFPDATLSTFTESWLESMGIDTIPIVPSRQLEVALTVSREIRQGRRDVAAGTVDFQDALRNIAHKALMAGYDAAPASFRRVCRITMLDDFRQAERPAVSHFGSLPKVGENGEITHSFSSQRGEYIQASSYVSTITLSRQALINDDRGALVVQPFAAGATAGRTINQIFYERLTSASGVGPNLNQTGRALFNSTDGNYDATSGALTVANLDIARQRLRRQRDPVPGKAMNIPGKYLLVPPAMETAARVVAASQNILDDEDNIEVVVEALLEDGTDGTTAWYLLADPERFDTFDIGFVGQPGPRFETADAPISLDGQSFKVGVDFGVAFLDHKTVYRRKGA